MDRYRKLLEGVSKGQVSVEEAMLQIKKAPFEDIGYANVDVHREAMHGNREVIYGAGKSAEQIIGILTAMRAAENKTVNMTEIDRNEIKAGNNRNETEAENRVRCDVPPVLITRLSPEKAEAIKKVHDITYYSDARAGLAGSLPVPDGKGKILIVSGGTSDLPVAEEAAITARVLGNEVERVYDVGVAGIHRLLAHMDEIMTARVIIAVAGMEGALASVVGGLAQCPVIAVPTSVGYGASFGGLSALLSMLNSCASGVSVVNIDNGFGAAYQASLINHM